MATSIKKIISIKSNMKTLTKKQLYEACLKHKYLAVRYTDNDVKGINTRILRLKKFKNYAFDDKETNVISSRPIDFQEYISIKGIFR